SGLAHRGHRRRLAGVARRQAVSGFSLHQLPQGRRPRPRPEPRRTLWNNRRDRGRPEDHRRRRVPARIDPEPAVQDREGLSTHHADVPGTGHRRPALATDRIHQVHRQAGGPKGGEPMITEAPAETRENYITAHFGIKSWLLTVDHKRIALLYLIAITFFFFLGGAFAVMIRLELLTPEGDLFQSETYNKLFTMHGIVMVFFFLIPSIPATLGNFLVPIMIGARDLAFPRLNLASWYIFMVGGCFTVFSAIFGGIDTGWTFYTPYSSTYSNTWVLVTAVGIFITGFSSILTGLNFIVTIHTMRAPGLTWFRLPLFIWSNYAASLIMVLGTPVVAVTLLLVLLERGFHIGIFDPALGGDPVLFQHLFWFYSHPAVYIMI